MTFLGTVKENWLVIPMYLFILSIAVISIFNTQMPLFGVNAAYTLPIILGAIVASQYKSSIRTARKYWASILVLSIVMLAFHIRLLDYGWPYLRNIDSYMFLRHMDYIIQNNGIMPTHDPLILAPGGGTIRGELFVYQYLGAYTFMFTSLFFTGLQLWQYLIYFPALLGALGAIPMYYLGKMLYDKRAGILAGTFYVFDFSNVSRSLGGDPDTDAITILFPILVIALFVFTYKHINKNGFNRRSLIYSIITGILMSLWAHTWEGYWYVLWLISAMIGAKIVSHAIMSRKLENKVQVILKKSIPIVVSYAIILVLLFLITFPAYGTGKINDFINPFRFQEIKSEEGIEFPNVYVSVAELQEGNVEEIIQRTSPINFSAAPLIIFISPIFLMIYALVYLAISALKNGKHIDTFILLAVWFIGPFMATLIAIRFATLFAAPLALGAAIFLAKIMNMIEKKEKIGD